MNTGYYNIKDGKFIKVKKPDDKGIERLVILFSCGITSFVATLLVLKENRKKWKLPTHIIYTYVKEEPKDNLRFLEDAEKYFKEKVLILVNEDFKGSAFEVFKNGWLVGVGGAACTKQLKWKVRKEFVTDNDIQVFGFNAGEEDRLDKFANGNNDINISCPLICMRLTKKDCLEYAQKIRIEPPESYRRGYNNANCIGCVKGQSGYWNHVRKVDKPIFDKMAKLERKLNVAINKKYKIYNYKNKDYINTHLKNDCKPLLKSSQIGENIRLRVFLDELDINAGRHKPIDLPDCGVLCELEMGKQKDLF